MQTSPLVQMIFSFNQGFVNTQNSDTIRWNCSKVENYGGFYNRGYVHRRFGSDNGGYLN